MPPRSLTTIGHLLWLANSMPLLESDDLRIINFKSSQLESDIRMTIFLTLSLLSNHGFVFRGFDSFMVNIPLLQLCLVLFLTVQRKYIRRSKWLVRTWL